MKDPAGDLADDLDAAIGFDMLTRNADAQGRRFSTLATPACSAALKAAIEGVLAWEDLSGSH